MFRFFLVFLFVGAALAPLRLSAQSLTTFLPEQLENLKRKDKKKEGWIPNLDLSFNFSFAQSDGVIGVPNGTTLNFGLQLDGKLIYVRGSHEWKSLLKIVHTQTKIPTIKAFLKAADQAMLETGYTYRFASLRWLGLFVGLRADTSLLEGYLVKEADTAITIKELDGTTSNQTAQGQKPFNLTKPFSPLFFKQSLGLVFLPYEKPFLNVDLKVGAGALQLWAQEGIRLEDNATTVTIIETSRIRDYVQAGVEFKAMINGHLLKESILYTLQGSVMLPFYTSIPITLSFAELFNVDLSFKLTIKVAKWLAINYSLTMIRAPLVQPKLQIVNNLVLSLTLNVL